MDKKSKMEMDKEKEMEPKNERLGNEVIRRFYGLQTRPQVKEATDAVIKKAMESDPTRKLDADQKATPSDQPLPTQDDLSIDK